MGLAGVDWNSLESFFTRVFFLKKWLQDFNFLILKCIYSEIGIQYVIYYYTLS